MSVLEIERQSQLPTTSNERRRAASALRSAGGRASLSPGVVGINCLNFCSCALERLCPRFPF